jgi:hypothetical protein
MPLAMDARFLVGTWPSPWASEPYLSIRVAIEVQTRAIVVLHQRRKGAWIRFDASDDVYVRDLISGLLDDVLEDPEAERLRWSENVPAAWLLDAALPREVETELPELTTGTPFNPFAGRRRKSRHARRRAARKNRKNA